MLGTMPGIEQSGGYAMGGWVWQLKYKSLHVYGGQDGYHWKASFHWQRLFESWISKSNLSSALSLLCKDVITTLQSWYRSFFIVEIHGVNLCQYCQTGVLLR